MTAPGASFPGADREGRQAPPLRKVPPLKARLALIHDPAKGVTGSDALQGSVGGRLPLTARSSTSSGNNDLATPRTGGGYTARSTGERGTPREAQRLALGERPRRDSEGNSCDDRPRPEGWAGGVPLSQSGNWTVMSPHHAAQYSGRTVSSDAWPTASSSAGSALSSRSCSDALSSRDLALNTSTWVCEAQGSQRGYPFQHGSYEASVQQGGHWQQAPGEISRSEQADLMKRLEVVRVVFIKENHSLRQLVQQVREGVAATNQLLADVTVRTDEDGDTRLPALTREPCRVEWCIEGVETEAPRQAASKGEEFGSWPASSGFGSLECPHFDLSALPGVNFMLRFFYPRGARANTNCELVLEVSGTACAALDIRVCLSLELCPDGNGGGDGTGSDANSISSAVSCAAKPGASTSSSASCVLHGGGKASCAAPWPAERRRMTVVCRAEVEELSWSVGTLHLRSAWSPCAEEVPG
eukprot:gnl/TRDRNA2_/TRDRNA2_27820_c0_seq1.p1 gnl/TRDRNA2_/TRDRNA2_27820_c0~~gnl/TRDRNA2_/TRDRNA2_27820_c0_seq1.p1  ORF type:complete len:471 (+),score=60.66 gnl/TRDRNA2_/TRDRNA2_27820_c0_seq1:80-1492(+)